MPVATLTNEEQFKEAISGDSIYVFLFAADWVEQCKQVEDVLEDLTKLSKNLSFIKVDAVEFPNVAMKYQVDAVPTVIFFSKGAAIDRVDGVDIANLTAKCKKWTSGETLEERLKTLINTAPLMIFMKGDRDAPKCGFSKQLIAIINELGFPYETFDILTDEEVRQGLKTFSDWPTYPQVYVKGELIGGLDIIKELKANNELEKTLKGE